MKSRDNGQRLHEIRVSPGWNLISLPSEPEETAIADALSGAEFLSPVMGYQQGEWLTAVKTDEGWQGSLTEIRAGYGYWAHALAEETFEVAVARPDQAAAVPVAYGWNLLGALDPGQNVLGESPGSTGGGADRCFAGLDWEVAYTLERNGATPEEVVWRRITPGGDGSEAIRKGSAYWVWVNAPGVLFARNAPARALAPPRHRGTNAHGNIHRADQHREPGQGALDGARRPRGYGRVHRLRPGVRSARARRGAAADGALRVRARRDAGDGRRADVDPRGDREVSALVLFNEEGTAPLLGAHALEGVFMGVDPVGKRLAPVGRLDGAGGGRLGAARSPLDNGVARS